MKKLVAALLIAVLCTCFVHADSNSPGYRIKINTASRTLTLYMNDSLIKEFPIAVGKPSTKSPLGSFKIVSKVVDPWWGNHGNPMPPGPNNPLGIRWMGISAPRGSYGIHGNSTPSSIGTFASGGCIRMFNSDVEGIFSIVSMGTPVQIVYENLELKQDKYTDTVAIVVYPNIYKQKTAEALINKFKADNATISEQQAAKAIKLANSGIKNTVAVSEGTPLLINNQFITNAVFIENSEAYIYYLAALDYFGLDSEAIESFKLKTIEKNDKLYINLTDAVSKIGGKIQLDKINNNIYFTGSLIKINGRFLSSYAGGFDREYSFNRAMLQSINEDIIPVYGAKQAVNLKDYTKEKNWKLNADSLLKIMSIDIPLRVKVGDKYFNTAYWNSRYYLKYEDSALIPGIENQVINIYYYNNVKYVDLYELMKGYEYKKDSFSTVIELIKPLSAGIDKAQEDAKKEADTFNTVK